MLKPALQLKLGQQLTMTPQLQQAIRLLQLPALDLQQTIREGLRGRKEQLLRTAYYEVSRNEAKVVNYFASGVVSSEGKSK